MLLITPLFLKLKCTITFNNHKIHYSLQSRFYMLGFLRSFFILFFFFFLIYGIICFYSLKRKTSLFLLALFIFPVSITPPFFSSMINRFYFFSISSPCFYFLSTRLSQVMIFTTRAILYLPLNDTYCLSSRFLQYWADVKNDGGINCTIPSL